MKKIDVKKAALFDELHRHLHNLVNKHRILDRTRRDFGCDEPLIGSEIHTIAAISKNNMANITELAKKLGITKAAASQAVRKLCIKGYIRKLRDDGNKKEVLLTLTEKGQGANNGHYVVWQNVCSIYLADIAEEQIKAFNLIALRIIAAADHEIEKNK